MILKKFIKIVIAALIALTIMIAWYVTFCSLNNWEIFDMKYNLTNDLFVHYLKTSFKEEFSYRYLPFIVATCIAVLIKKKFKLNKLILLIFGLAIAAMQIQFAVIHIPMDEDVRTIILNLPAKPTTDEYIQAILMQGIGGIILSAFYFVAIDKKRPLYLLQLIPFVATVALHCTYDIIIATCGEKVCSFSLQTYSIFE